MQINPLDKPAVMVTLLLMTLVITFAARVHAVVLALSEAIFLRSVVRDDCAVHGAIIMLA